MFRPRSIPPWSPPLDRLVIRAALAKDASWPRTGVEIAQAVARAAGREGTSAQWVPHPEAALIAAVDAARPGARVAAPAWGASQYGTLLEGRDVVWMEPARHRLDPGRSEVVAALDAGADAILLAPVAGDCTSLLGVSDLCATRSALLAVDARSASGGRVLDGSPAAVGNLALATVDGEPGPAPCPGAVLFGAPDLPLDGAEKPTGHALALLRDSLRAEPRLRRLWNPQGGESLRARVGGAAPTWAFAAAAARLQQAGPRASQRARHARALRRIISHIEGVDLPSDPPGIQSAGGTLGLLVKHRDAIARRLATAGVPTLSGGLGWLAPGGQRPKRAEAVAEKALLLPLLPFYRPRDLDFVGEELRRAALRASDEAT